MTGPIMAGMGFGAATLIATAAGWRAAGRLRVGDGVLTLDAGVQPLVAVNLWPVPRRGVSSTPVWPLRVPAGGLGNRRALDLAPGQAIAVECDVAEALLGAPLALPPVAALMGWRGIGPVAPAPGSETMVALRFAAPQIVYAEGAALLACGGPCLSMPQARRLAACLMAEEVGAALARATP